MTNYTDKEIELLRIDRDEHPEFYRDFYGEYGYCEECGSEMVMARSEADNGLMCYKCGFVQGEDGWGEDGPPDLTPIEEEPDTMTEYSEKEQRLLRQDRSEHPFFNRMAYGDYDPCEECGSEVVGTRPSNTSVNMCFDCGAVQDGKGWGNDDPPDIASKSAEEKQAAKDDATRNIGKMFQMIGLLFTLTLVGAIVGIPLLILGMHIETKNIDDED